MDGQFQYPAIAGDLDSRWRFKGASRGRGLAQLLIGIPGLAFMLWGGAMGDRWMVAEFYPIPPIERHSTPGARLRGLCGPPRFWLLIITALATNLLNSISNPARNTILNQIAGQKLQIAISVSTGIGSIATMVGTRLAGEIDRLGLINILIVQSLFFALGAICLLGLRAAVPNAPEPNVIGQSSINCQGFDDSHD